MAPDFREVDMSEPVKEFFIRRGYDVQAEVLGIDLVAMKGKERILLELKTSFNLKLIYQGLDRQKTGDPVYLVIPRPKRGSLEKPILIAKRLELGLITVGMDSPMRPVEIVSPAADGHRIGKKRVEKLDAELDGRSMDLNRAGSTGTKLMTAFRERAIQVACALYQNGPRSAAALKKDFACSEDTYGILYRNHYKWFEKLEKGVYRISEEGRRFLEERTHFPEAIDFYLAYTSYRSEAKK